MTSEAAGREWVLRVPDKSHASCGHGERLGDGGEIIGGSKVLHKSSPPPPNEVVQGKSV